MIFKIAILLFAFLSAGLLAHVLLPPLIERYHRLQKKKIEIATKKLDNLFMDVERKKLFFIFIFAPLILGAGAGIFYNSPIAGIIGVFVGIALPNIFIGMWEKARQAKFRLQLMDGLMVLSGCLRAGLSLQQAFEVMIEDMPPPISQEFGWLLKEMKMGISLEESMKRLNKRMPSEDLRLLTNAVLVSEMTGGDLSKVLGRIVTTIRDNRKIKESIHTLTMQGKIQGTVMSILPFLFIWWVLTFNRQQFDIMFSTETGRNLLITAGVLLVVGIFLIRKFSIIKI